MTPTRWRQVEHVLDQVLDGDAEMRTRLLEIACRGDERLRQQVSTLLQHHTQASGDLRASSTLLMAGLLGDVGAAEAEEEGGGCHIGPYRLVRMLGRGGMGTVYLAQQGKGAGRKQVALKLLHPAPAARAEDVRRFRAERQILAALEHPNIARLLDEGVTTGKDFAGASRRPYLVMEYVEGQPLDDYCDEHQCSLRQRLQLFQSVCEAVQQAHRRQVVHRDLKPGNILVTEAGNVKLLDFGIAKIMDAENALPATRPVTRPGMHLMTPAYAAPEQAGGGRITSATDVYQLGTLLYRLLTGQLPLTFDDDCATEVAQVLREEIPEPPAMVVSRRAATCQHGGASPCRAAVPGAAQADRETRTTAPRVLCAALRGDLGTVVMKALRKEPAQRYASAKAFADDVQRYLEDLPVRAQKMRRGNRVRKYARQHSVSVGLAVLLVVLLGGAAAIIVVQAQRLARERAQARHATVLLAQLFETVDSTPRTYVETKKNLLGADAPYLQRRRGALPEIQVRLAEPIGWPYWGDGFYREAPARQRYALACPALGVVGLAWTGLRGSADGTVCFLSRPREAVFRRRRALHLRRLPRAMVLGGTTEVKQLLEAAGL